MIMHKNDDDFIEQGCVFGNFAKSPVPLAKYDSNNVEASDLTKMKPENAIFKGIQLVIIVVMVPILLPFAPVLIVLAALGYLLYLGVSSARPSMKWFRRSRPYWWW